MKTKLLLTALIAFFFLLFPCEAQVPQGFNYQAIARDGSGNQIINQTLQVKLAIMADSLGSNIYWEELFNPVTTNAFGLFTVVMGQGVRQATSTLPAFSSINWKITPIFIRTQIYYPNAWKNMGSTRFWSVPFALVSNNANTANGLSGAIPYLGVSGNTVVLDSALFAVRNNIGQIIFAVYNEGVRIYVDNGQKGSNKGGFAIGSFGTGKGSPSQEYFRVTSDSTRVYVNPNAKGTKGGFAIGGFGAKGADRYLNLTPSNYFIGQGSGLNVTTGLYNSFIGYQSGLTNSTGNENVFLGYQTGYYNNADYNSFIGYQAGYYNTTGAYNAFIGYKAGYGNTSGYYNVFLGWLAGLNNTDGTGNVFIGEGAGISNKHGGTNTFVGASAGASNNANFNTFVGYNAGNADTSGYENIFVGYYSGAGNKAGIGNTIVGDMAAQYYEITNNSFFGDLSGRNNSGNNNTFMGYGSGYACTTGSTNVMLGSEAGSQSYGGSGNIFIGYYAGYAETLNNKLIIQNTSDITTPTIGGDLSNRRVGIARMPTTYTLEVGGTIWANGASISNGATTWSDVRYKKDISPLTNALENVLMIQGVRYNWKRADFPQLNFPEGEQIGVIAQDVEKIIPELVYTGPDGYKSVSYEKLTPVLVEAMKEQQKIIIGQRNEIKGLNEEIGALKSRMDQIESLLSKSSNK